MNDHKTSTQTLVSALRILAGEIQSDDGVANMTIAEAADRIEELVEYYGEALALERNRADQAEQRNAELVEQLKAYGKYAHDTTLEDRNAELVAALTTATNELQRATVVTDGHPSVSHNLMLHLREVIARSESPACRNTTNGGQISSESAAPAKHPDTEFWQPASTAPENAKDVIAYYQGVYGPCLGFLSGKRFHPYGSSGSEPFTHWARVPAIAAARKQGGAT